MTDETTNSGLPVERNSSGRFTRGPGRKPGSRNKRLLFWADLETKAQSAVEAVVDKLIEKAKEGDTKAADLFLSRTWIAPRSRKLPVRLPNITDSIGLAAAYQATAKALSDGLIDPDEACKVAALLEGQRKNLEGSDILQRLKAIEDRIRGEAISHE